MSKTTRVYFGVLHPTFGIRPTFYMPFAALIRRPDDMLSSPLTFLSMNLIVGLPYQLSPRSMAPLTLTIIYSIIVRR